MERKRFRGRESDCIKIFLIYKDKGLAEALEYSEKIFGEGGEHWMKKRLQFYDQGGWSTDWMTKMFKDLDKMNKTKFTEEEIKELSKKFSKKTKKKV